MTTQSTFTFLATVLMASSCGEESAVAPPVLAAPQAAVAPKQEPSKSAHERMLAALKEILDKTDGENPLLGGFKMRNYRKALENMPETAPRANRFRLLVELGDATVYYGDEREGLAFFQRAFHMGPEEIPDDIYQDSKIRFAAAWLRLAETENCCASHNAESCILPIRGAAVHTKQEGSTRAVALLNEVIAAADEQERREGQRAEDVGNRSSHREHLMSGSRQLWSRRGRRRGHPRRASPSA